MRWVWLSLAACGGDVIDPDPLPPPVDAPPFVPGANTVRLAIDGGGAPDYIRYRNGTSGWTTPMLVEPDVYELHVDDAYDVVMVCGDDTFVFDTEILYRTFADGEVQSLFCFPDVAAAAPSHSIVTGQMQQAGEVFMGGYASSLSSPWTYQLDVAHGTHDLIAVGFDAIAVRRDEVIDGARTMDPIDLDLEGARLTVQPYGTNAMTDETIDASIGFQTLRGFAQIQGSPTQLRIPPASILQSGDFVQTFVQATSGEHYRTYLGSPTTQVDFLPRLDATFSFTSTQIHASWSKLPESYQELTFGLFAFGSGFQLGTISATQRWVDATGTKRVSFEDVPPDFDNKYLPGLGVEYNCDLSVRTGSAQTRWVSGMQRAMSL